jgi:hypothetical protein
MLPPTALDDQLMIAQVFGDLSPCWLNFLDDFSGRGRRITASFSQVGEAFKLGMSFV